MEIRVFFQPMNRMVTVKAGTSLFTAISLAGIAIEGICGGKGTCGKCRVILNKGNCQDAPATDSGCRATHKEQELGYHLACQVKVTGDAEFTIPVESRIDSPQILITRSVIPGGIDPAVKRYRVDISPSDGLPFASRSVRFAGYTGVRPRMSDERSHALLASDIPQSAILSESRPIPVLLGISPADDTTPLYGIAVDLGTTTVVGCLVRLDTGDIIATGSPLNRQITYGEELLTRVGYASSPAGLGTLQKAATDSINDVIGTLSLVSGVKGTDIVDVCIAGNTVMNHLLCGLNADYLELIDVPVSRVPIQKTAYDLGLAVHPDAGVYCLSNVSRFVGGDAVGDMITASVQVSDELSLIVDLGTNGEIVPGNRNWAASVSCASGPAFEGAGIRSGMRAMKGAIDHIRVNPETSEITWSTIGNCLARGICGSGNRLI